MNNTMTNIMTNNNINFEICHLDQLLEINASKTIELEVEYMHFISIFIASIIAIFSMFYGFIRNYFKNRGLTLHFVGIGRPANFSKSQYKLFENINTESTMITMQSSLKPNDTISTLKELIKKTYAIESNHDILILYSHHMITDNLSTLKDVGITNNSLLTLAICPWNKIIPPPKQQEVEEKIEEAPEPEIEREYESESESEDNGDLINTLFGMYQNEEEYASDPEPVGSVNELFAMFQDDIDSDDDKEEKEKQPTPPPPTWPRLGFDIITQENDVLVHKMPKCGHEMNHNSLHQYALNTFNNSRNLCLKCPHSLNDNVCDTKWEYTSIIDILRYKEDDQENKWMDYAKLELLASRNIIENEMNVQKCPGCKTLYVKNYNEEKKSLDEIKTVQDIENEFKFQCILCPSNTIEIIEKIPIIKNKKEASKGIHNEDDIKEDIDGDAINIMFGNEDDSDDDDDDEEEEEEEEYDDDNMEAIKAINHMFDDDEPDFEEIIKSKSFDLFCWCCGTEWSDGHICDSSFKYDLVSILSMAEIKKIGSVEGVPSIRCCPNCCQLLFHVDCCKHMVCRSCQTDFCFVCMKMKKNGKWQCGSHSSKCPVADRQNMQTLPDTIVITKKLFQLY